MNIAWILYSIAIAAIIGLSAFSLEYGLRRRGIPLRWLWLAAMCAALTLSSIPWIRSFGVINSVADQVEPPVLTILKTAALSPGRYAELSPSPIVAGLSWGAIQSSAIVALVEQYFIYAWILASFAVAMYLGIAHRRLARRRRMWRHLTLDGRPVLISKDVGPAVVGLLNQAVVLPEWVLDLSPEQRKLILAHETEHTKAGDPSLLALASLCLVFMPWNAPLWWYVRRLRHAVELDCDARVLRGTPDATAYGELLVDVGERGSLRWLGVATFGDSSSFLAGRIRNIVGPRPRAWRLFAGVGICAMGLLMVAACEMPSPTTLGSTDVVGSSSDEVNSHDVLAAVRDADIKLGNPSLVAGVEREGQPVAPGSLEIVSRGRPNAENLLTLVQHLHPEMRVRGLDADQALWVAVDASGGVRKSWVGPKLIFDVLDEYRPQPYLSLPVGSPERIAYEAHLRKKAAMLQQNVPDLQIRSEITLGFGSMLLPDHSGLLRFVTEIPGKTA